MAVIVLADTATEQREQLCRWLTAWGHGVLCVEHGADAVALVRRVRPAAVLLATELPVLDGFKATRQLTRQPATRDIPVILMAPHERAADRAWAQRQGAQGWLRQPVQAEPLKTLLQWVLNAQAR